MAVDSNVFRGPGSTGATVTGALVPGNVPILTATGIQDSGVALVSTMAATTVWSNNTSGDAAPGANTVLTLGNGTAAAPIYSFNASPGTGVYSPATNQVALTAGGNRGFQVRSTDATSYLEYIYSGGVVLRAQGGTNTSAYFMANGTGEVFLGNNGGATNSAILRLKGPASAGGSGNILYLQAGNGTGNGPVITALANGTSDTNIDIRLTPVGTGVLRFGTHSAIAAETVTGYITIKDSGGTTRKIAVVS